MRAFIGNYMEQGRTNFPYHLISLIRGIMNFDDDRVSMKVGAHSSWLATLDFGILS